MKLKNSTFAVDKLNKSFERVVGTIIVPVIELPTMLIPSALIVNGPPELSSHKNACTNTNDYWIISGCNAVSDIYCMTYSSVWRR